MTLLISGLALGWQRPFLRLPSGRRAAGLGASAGLEPEPLPRECQHRLRAAHGRAGREFAETLKWDSLTPRWTDLIESQLEGASDAPLVKTADSTPSDGAR